MENANLAVFFGVTVVLFGAAAWLMGRAIGETWRPAWQCVPYGLMLTVANRFVVFALFGGDGLSISGFVIDALVIVAVALFAQRLTRARKMVQQYPWLFDRAGLLGWREKG